MAQETQSTRQSDEKATSPSKKDNRSLRELLCNDFTDVASRLKDHVLSEEGLRYLIYYHQKSGQLAPGGLLNTSQIYAVLKGIVDSYDPEQGELRYQFFIETGQRGKVKQRDKGTIHYTAFDLLLHPSKPPTLMIADHYKGFKAQFEQMEKFVKESKVAVNKKQVGHRILDKGGYFFQADDVSCPIFALNHLLKTFKDEQYFDTPAKDGQILWEDLPPDYQVHSQSVSYLHHYVDKFQNAEKSKDGEVLALISPTPMSPRGKSFVEEVQGSLYAVQKPGDQKLHLKVMNQGISLAAAEYAGTAVLALESNAESDREVLAICYKENPEVYALLQAASAAQLDDDRPHPLFELAFYNIECLKICLKNSKFKAIFSDPNILKLMQLGHIDSYELYNFVTTAGREIEIDANNITLIFSNLAVVPKLLQYVEQGYDLTGFSIDEALKNRNTKGVFTHPALLSLIDNGYLSLGETTTILPYKVQPKSFPTKVEAQLQALASAFKFSPKFLTTGKTLKPGTKAEEKMRSKQQTLSGAEGSTSPSVVSQLMGSKAGIFPADKREQPSIPQLKSPAAALTLSSTDDGS